MMIDDDGGSVLELSPLQTSDVAEPEHLSEPPTSTEVATSSMRAAPVYCTSSQCQRLTQSERRFNEKKSSSSSAMPLVPVRDQRQPLSQSALSKSAGEARRRSRDEAHSESTARRQLRNSTSGSRLESLSPQQQKTRQKSGFSMASISEGEGALFAQLDQERNKVSK